MSWPIGFQVGNPPRAMNRAQFRALYRAVRICNRETTKAIRDMALYGSCYIRTDHTGMPRHVSYFDVVNDLQDPDPTLRRIGST